MLHSHHKEDCYPSLEKDLVTFEGKKVQQTVMDIVEYMVGNDLQHLARQFFKMVPLTLVLKVALMDRYLTVQRVEILNIVFKLVYQQDHTLADSKCL